MIHLLRLMAWLAARLPLGLVLWGGRVLGWLWFYLLRYRRQVALDNVAQALPERSPAERRAIVRGMGRNLGMVFAEFFGGRRYTRANIDRYVSIAGLDELRRVLATGRGAILVAGHLGNWELAAHAMDLNDLPGHVVYYRFSSPTMERFVAERRTNSRVGLIAHKDSSAQIKQLLRDGKVVVFPIDQHMAPKRAVVATFFGRPAATTPAPTVYAHKTGAAMFTAFMRRARGPRHEAVLTRLPDLDPAAPLDQLVAERTQQLNDHLEAWIRQHPDQWMWTHRRWKLLPPP